MRWLALAGLGLVATACAGEDGDRTTRIHVFAASSLTEAFRAVELEFERAYEEADAVLSFAGSQVLRLQIERGAGADVFASADRRHLDALVRAGLMDDARVFARNELVIIVPSGNPARIGSLTDLLRVDRLVIGGRNVPAGAYAREMLERAESDLGAGFAEAVMERVVSEENNVRLVRAKVELGEADAALVYRSDAAVSERVEAIAIPRVWNPPGEYAMGILADGPGEEWGQRWVAFVQSPVGRSVLRRHGFTVDPS